MKVALAGVNSRGGGVTQYTRAGGGSVHPILHLLIMQLLFHCVIRFQASKFQHHALVHLHSLDHVANVLFLCAPAGSNGSFMNA